MSKIICKKIQCIIVICILEATNIMATTIQVENSNILSNSYFKNIPGFLVSPLQIKGEIISEFNEDRGNYIHQGVDIRTVVGTPVFASEDGIVTKAAPDSKGINSGGGNMIFINYGQGVEARYMHLNTYNVVEGELVKRGDVIGFTGNTGDAQTPHLHFEYRIDDVPIDPLFIFEASDMIKYDDINNGENNKENSSIEDNSTELLYDTGFLVIQR